MGESVTSLLAASSTETRFRTGRPGRVVSALSLPDGRRVVAKRYSDDRGALAYRSMNELWRSSFGERRRPPGLPRPLGYDASRGVLLMEWIDGRPWLELGAWDARRLRDAVSLLADLHASNAAPIKERSSRKVVASVRRKTASAVTLAPEFADLFIEASDALAARCLPDAELVPTHGDFNLRNVLVAGDRVVLIDWDRFQGADPARDLGFLGSWFWVSLLRERRQPNWDALDWAVTTYERLRPGASLCHRLDFHAAAGLVRIAFSRLHLWPDEIGLVPAILNEAIRRVA